MLCEYTDLISLTFVCVDCVVQLFNSLWRSPWSALKLGPHFREPCSENRS
jgi:hypothetical protein